MSVVYGHKNGVIEYPLGTSLLCCKSSKIKVLWFKKVLIQQYSLAVHVLSKVTLQICSSNKGQGL